MEIAIIIFLIFLGVALLMAEIFLLPGITVAGVAGFISLIGAIVYAFMYIGDTAGFITIAVTVVACAATFIYLVKSKAMNKIALETDIDAKVDQSELTKIAIGDVGECISRLNPIGKAEINGLVVEAKSANGEYIDEGQKVRVVKVDTYNVWVELTEE
ncbi:hypothetical protein D0T53_13060 [Dysgonomonas sp. 216]|uniref:NfeD family protein n=1 Tax=Dysgonomonas sp. 216 TaxID=2302934 RepID=UPI0013D18EEC|nr:NfeD family protein [Dysgonomonas sp. 216]NDW19829.1 hypothetical protein [Dysgonomonas sp. 216]